jgi:hypothetical protein
MPPCHSLTESCFVYIEVRRGGRNRRRSRRQAETVRYFSDCIRGMDCRYNPHAAAMCTFENVDRKNSLHQFGPCVIPGVTYPGLLRTCALGMGYVFPGRAAGVRDGLACFGGFGNHERPPARAQSQDAAIPDQVEPGREHERQQRNETGVSASTLAEPLQRQCAIPFIGSVDMPGY